MPVPQLDKLKGILLNSGIQKENAQLYQVIVTLIDYLRRSSQEIAAVASSGGGTSTSLATIMNADFLTSSDESADFPNSRELLAGVGIAFDDTVANARTINATAPGFVEWSVLTNGNVINPELIFAGGDVVMTHTP